MKKLNETMKTLGLDPKKEWSFFFLGFVLVAALFGCGYYFLLRELLVVFIGAICLILYIPLFLSRYARLLKRRQKLMLSQFVDSMHYFEAYLGFGYTAYRALEETASLAKKEISPLYETLLKEMESDKSMMPFLNFASHFESLEVRQAILIIYEFGDKKKRKTATFSSLIERMEESCGRLPDKEDASSLDAIKVAPLMASGISILSLALAIIKIIGGLYHVI